MFGKMNAKAVEGMMKRMGISQAGIDARRVTIELDDRNLVIDEPSVTRINMQGQDSFQVSGAVREESREGFSDEDVQVVMEKTGAERDRVAEILKANGGDIAGAILELKQ